MMRARRRSTLLFSRRTIVLVLFVVTSLSSIPIRAQFSRPVATAADSLAHAARSKFSSRESTGDLGSHPLTGEDDDEDDSFDDRPSFHHSFALDADAGACGAPLSHLWTADAGASSIAATPLITDLFSDGSKEVIVPAFVHELEALDGASGARWADGRWPAFHGSSAHASPILADVDGDGVQEVLLATYDGRVSAYRDTGERIRLVDEEGDGKGGLAFPRLRVRTLWYEGLAADPTAHDRPDLGHNADAQRELEEKLVEEALAARESSGSGSGGGGGRRRRRRSLMQVANDAAASAAAATSVEAEAKATFDELFAERGKGGGNGDVAGGGGADSTMTTTTTFADADSGTASLSASDRQQLTPDQMAALLAEGIDAAEIEGIQERLANEAEAEIEAAENAQTGGGGGGGGGAESLGGGDDGASELWGGDRPDVERLPSSEALKRAGVDPQATGGALPEFILVDAHVLATPVVADVDGDGHDELVAAVSYFFDDAEWPRPRVDRELGRGVDIDKYVMAGAVAISLRGGGGRRRGDVVWASHLDSSASSSRFQARALASPSVADVDRDGSLEVVVTTTLGFVYILEGATGKARDGWPLQLAPLQGSAALADVDGCGRLELIVADEAGTVACLKSSSSSSSSSSPGIAANGTAGGESASLVLWERHLGAAVTATPALGDVDGDGDLEVVVGDAAGSVWCLDARTGLDANRWQHGKGDVAARRNALWPWKRESSSSSSSSSSGTSSSSSPSSSSSSSSSSTSSSSRRGARGRIVSAPLLVPLGDPPLQQGRYPPLRVVVPAFDGVLYAISGDGACFDSIDLGEASYSRPLADDIDGDGSLEIVLATMSGSVHALKAGRAGVSHRADLPAASAAAAAALRLPPLAAAALAAAVASPSSASDPPPPLQLDADDPPPADPLAVTAEALPDGNRFVCSAPAFEGVRALDPDRRPRDVRGRELSVRFEVVDRRARRAGPEIPSSSPIAARPTGDAGAGRGPYRVTVSLQGVGPEQMIGGGVGSGSSSSSAGAAVVGMTGTYPRPGIYSLTLPVPRARTTATVRVEMVDEVTDRAPPPLLFSSLSTLFFPFRFCFHRRSFSPLFLSLSVPLSPPLSLASSNARKKQSGTRFSDSFALSFHVHAHRALKFMVAAPALLAAAAVAAVGGGGGGRGGDRRRRRQGQGLRGRQRLRPGSGGGLLDAPLPLRF